MFTERRRERTLFREQKSTRDLLFFLYFALSQRERRQKKRRAERRERFFILFFFCASFSQRIHCSLSLLSLSPSLFALFSLSFLSLSSSFRVCVFARILSTQIYLFGGGFQSHPIIVVLIFPRYKSKQQQQHAKRAFYSVNARNKNRDTHTHALKQKARERTVRRTIFDFYIIKW